MSSDQFEKCSKKSLSGSCGVVKTPLHFNSFSVGDTSALSPVFNINLYQLRLINYTKHLKHLLDNPPVLKPDCGGEFDYEKLDNYLWVVGEIISSIYEMHHDCKPDCKADCKPDSNENSKANSKSDSM